MAQINKNKSIVGILGNTVLRERDGKTLIQSRPESVKQTERTKVAGSEFRQCSSWAKRLRIGLRQFIDNGGDGNMHSRFAGALYSTLQLNSLVPKGQRTPLNSDMSSLAGFEFNSHSPFADYFAPEIVAELNEQRQVVVTVPEFNPRGAVEFALNTKQAELLIYVLATNFESNTGFPDDHTVIPIPNNYSTISETTWTSQPMPEGHLVLVCAKLLFYNTNRFTEKSYVNSKECSPMRVVACTRVS
jgi:hypothetical protein